MILCSSMQMKLPDNSEFIRKYYCLLILLAANFSLQNKLFLYIGTCNMVQEHEFTQYRKASN